MSKNYYKKIKCREILSITLAHKVKKTRDVMRNVSAQNGNYFKGRRCLYFLSHCYN